MYSSQYSTVNIFETSEESHHLYKDTSTNSLVNVMDNSSSEDVDHDDSNDRIYIMSPECFEDSSMEVSPISIAEDTSSSPLEDKGSEEVNLRYEVNATEAEHLGGREYKIGKILQNLRDREKDEKCKRFVEENFCSNVSYKQEYDHNYAQPFENLQHERSSKDDKSPLTYIPEEMCGNFSGNYLSSDLNITYPLDQSHESSFEEKEIKSNPDEQLLVKTFCYCLEGKLSEQSFTCNCGYQNFGDILLQMSPQTEVKNDPECSKEIRETLHNIKDQMLHDQSSNSNEGYDITSNTSFCENPRSDSGNLIGNLKDELQESIIPKMLKQDIQSDDNSDCKPMCSSSGMNIKEVPTGNPLEKSDLDIPRHNYSGLDSISLNSEDFLLSFSCSDSGYSDPANSVEECINNFKNLADQKDDSKFLSEISQNTFEEKTSNVLSLNHEEYEDRNTKSVADLASCTRNSENRSFTVYDTIKHNILKNCEILGKNNLNSSDFIPYILCQEALLRDLKIEHSSDAWDSFSSSEELKKLFPIKSSNSSQNNLSEKLSDNSLSKTEHPKSQGKYFDPLISSETPRNHFLYSFISANISKEKSDTFRNLLAKVSDNSLIKSSTYFRFYDIDSDIDVNDTIDTDRECSINSCSAIEERKKFDKLVQNLSNPLLEDSMLHFSSKNSSELKDYNTKSRDSLSDSNSEEYYTCCEFEDSVIYTRFHDTSTPCKTSRVNFYESLGSKLEGLDLMVNQELFQHRLESEDFLTFSQNGFQ